MRVENPLAYSFILQDEVFLLNKDKEWYGSTAAPEPIEEPAPPVGFNYLGKYKNNILVIVHYANTEFIDERHLAALESTFKRLGFELGDAAILNKATHPDAAFSQLVEFFKPQKLLILGKNGLPGDVHSLALNELQIVNSCNTLLSFSFDEMMDNNENKKAFWEQMKQL